MANEKSMYAVFQGGYNNAAEEAERWQFGVRLALVFGAVSAQGTFPSNWEVNAESTTDTSGDWTVRNQWSALGPLTFTFNPQSYMEDYLIPSFETYLDSFVIGQDAVGDTIKLYPINSAGKVIEGRSCTAVASPGHAGSEVGTTLPLQNSIVISTATEVIGRKGRGRWYMPCVTTNGITAHGRISSSHRGNQLAAAKAFLEGITYASSGSGDAHVHSVVTGAPWVNYGRITGISVGDVIDTQRRRRRQLTEARVSDTIAS